MSFHGGLVAASPEAAARNKAKFLICHGAMDPTMKREVVDGFLKSLDDGKVVLIGGIPMLVVAVRYFFRREVETDAQLFHGLAFAA